MAAYLKSLPATAQPISSKGWAITAPATRRAAGRFRRRRSTDRAVAFGSMLDVVNKSSPYLSADDGSSTYLEGAELDAWFAPNLRGDQRTGLGAWSQGDLAAFLSTGHNDRAVAFGSMLDVVNK